MIRTWIHQNISDALRLQRQLYLGPLETANTRRGVLP